MVPNYWTFSDGAQFFVDMITRDIFVGYTRNLIFSK